MNDALRSHHLSAVLRIPDIIIRLTSAELLNMLQIIVTRAGLTPVSWATANFEPHGTSAVVLLKESHVAVHVWPELGKMTVDIHVCDFTGDNLERARSLAGLLNSYHEFPENMEHWNMQIVSG